MRCRTRLGEKQEEEYIASSLSHRGRVAAERREMTNRFVPAIMERKKRKKDEAPKIPLALTPTAAADLVVYVYIYFYFFLFASFPFCMLS